MAKDSDDIWSDMADELAKNVRPHAGYFKWETDRQMEEWGVVSAFAESLEKNNALFFENWTSRKRGDDPPDCEASVRDGAKIGIEVTELVCGESAAKARAGELYSNHDWCVDLVGVLQEILKEKEKKKPKGGPYERYVLLVHTDEPWLDLKWIRKVLEEHQFQQTQLISDAYFLVSYDPIEQMCPYFKLNIQNQSGNSV